MSKAIFHEWDHIALTYRQREARVLKLAKVLSVQPGLNDKYENTHTPIAELEVNFGSETSPRWVTLMALRHEDRRATKGRSFYTDDDAGKQVLDALHASLTQSGVQTSAQIQPPIPPQIQPPIPPQAVDPVNAGGPPPPPRAQK